MSVSKEDVCINNLGQIVLDLETTISISEVWLFKNKYVKDAIEKGLDELHQGKIEYLGSFAKYAKD